MAVVHAASPVPNASSSSGSVSTATSSLYLGDLPLSVTEGTLFDAFSEFKSLTSVRLCKDVSTRRSLCYGFANFLSRQDAELAIEKKNHSMLDGKMIRVMWSVKEPDARRNGVGNVFVKNLPDSINNAGLQAMFKKFGNIVSCKVETFEDGKSRGYGFVQFEQDDVANTAIENLNGSIVADKEIFVGKFMSKTDRAKLQDKYTNLYIKNLDSDVSDDLLRERFSQFGTIVSLAIAKDENGLCKGFAFVNFINEEDARRAVETMNGTKFGTKYLFVGRAQKKAERELLLREQFGQKHREQNMQAKGENIFVKNIDLGATEEELRTLFSQCGRITSAKLMCDAKGISKGFGFVNFSTPEEATDAVKTYHGQKFHGKRLYVAIAQKKEDRQMQLQVQFGKQTESKGSSSSSASVSPMSYYYNTNPHSGMLYQSYGIYPSTWNSTSLINSSYPYQGNAYPLVVANAARKMNQNRKGKLNSTAVSFEPNVYHQSTQTLPLTRDISNQQQNRAYGRGKEKEGLKQWIGEQLYPLVEKFEPQFASKVTGMLVQMDISELFSLLKSPKKLAGRIDEALEALKSSKINLTN